MGQSGSLGRSVWWCPRYTCGHLLFLPHHRHSLHLPGSACIRHRCQDLQLCHGAPKEGNTQLLICFVCFCEGYICYAENIDSWSFSRSPKGHFCQTLFNNCREIRPWFHVYCLCALWKRLKSLKLSFQKFSIPRSSFL